MPSPAQETIPPTVTIERAEGGRHQKATFVPPAPLQDFLEFAPEVQRRGNLVTEGRPGEEQYVKAVYCFARLWGRTMSDQDDNFAAAYTEVADRLGYQAERI